MTSPFLPEQSGHEVFEELAAGWVLHSLEPDDEARFTAHMQNCPPCQHAVAAYTGALSEIAQSGPGAAPPARLGERIHDEVALDLRTPARRRPDVAAEIAE